jgi:natural product biosynthesis luciferase-like monooxygenase protein
VSDSDDSTTDAGAGQAPMITPVRRERHRMQRATAPPLPAADSAADPPGDTGPRNAVERQIAAVWQELLKIERVDVHANFFQLGGHSVLATQLISRLRRAFERDIPLRGFVETPTIAGLAALIDADAPHDGAPAPAIRPVARQVAQAQRPAPVAPTERRGDGDAMQFSLFFFSADEQRASSDKYRLMIEAAIFADQHGFQAIWTPERHFQAFGGLYPNPAVTSAALAMVTERIQLRAGSVVLPLHDPIAVAETWSMVDNLSHGRVGVSFAAGWHVNDFVLAPETYAARRDTMVERAQLIGRLWRGEALQRPNGVGNSVPVRIFPRPVQPTLPIWLTCLSGETFIKAGEIGAHVLTALLSHDIAQLTERIAAYRATLAAHGHDPQAGLVTVMLHTFVGDTDAQVGEKALPAYTDYIRTNIDLQASNAAGLGMDIDAEVLTEADLLLLAATRFARLAHEGLVGTPDVCLRMLDELRDSGANEIACLIDFIADADVVMDGIRRLTALRDHYRTAVRAE